MGSRIDTDLFVQGTLQMTTLVPSAGCVSNTHIHAAANIATTKMLHLHRKHYGQSGTAVAAILPFHFVYGSTGTLKTVKAGMINNCNGNAAVTVDIHLNGISTLTNPIILDSGDADRALVVGTFNSTALVANDFLECIVTVDAGTGDLGTGLGVEVELEEAAL